MERTIAILLLLTSLLVIVCATPVGSTKDRKDILDKVPRKFSCTFRWHGDESIQEISISIRSVNVDENDNIIAIGSGRYVSSRGPTDVEIMIELSSKILQFEMWESDPVDNTEVVLGGSHVGKIREDLQTIEALWTTSESGEQGDLELRAR